MSCRGIFGSRRACATIGATLGLLTFAAGLRAASVNEPLRIAIIDGSAAPEAAGKPFAAALTSLLGSTANTVGSKVDSLRSANAALLIHGPGASISAGDAAMLRQFIESGAGIVVVAARAEMWPREVPLPELLGAAPTGTFAEGAPLSVIDLFAHPILSGITRLETTQPVTRYDKLAQDAQMIIEGTVGEATTPLAWVRKRGNGRFCHVAFGNAELFAHAVYHRLIANALLWTNSRPIPGARPAVQRTFMPEAHPGSFAITLPEGPGICFDPVRGGINYIWDGDFVDLRPRWLTKQGEPPRIFGEMFYQEKAWRPLRAGAPDGPDDFQFRGYTLRDGWPEFHYRIGGREVHESFRAAAGGGVTRHFRVEEGSSPLWLQLEPQSGAELIVTGLERDGIVASFSNPGAGEFTVEIRRKQLRLP